MGTHKVTSGYNVKKVGERSYICVRSATGDYSKRYDATDTSNLFPVKLFKTVAQMKAVRTPGGTWKRKYVQMPELYDIVWDMAKVGHNDPHHDTVCDKMRLVRTWED